MPAGTPSTPGYCCHRSTGRAYVRLNGRMIYLGPWKSAESRAEYDRVLREYLAHGRRTGSTVQGDWSVEEIIAAYLPYVEGYYVKDGRPTSEQASIKAALAPVRRLYAATPAASFGPAALRSVRQVFIDAGHVRKSVNRHVNRIRQLFKWAVSQELVPAAVLTGLQAVAGLKRGRCDAPDGAPVRPVNDTCVDAVKPHVSRQVWALIELQRLTGMRSGEAVTMRGCDLDTTGALWLYRPASHKTEHYGHERVIELGPKAQAVVTPFLKPDLQAYLFSPADAVVEARATRAASRKTPRNCGNRPGLNRKRKPRKSPGARYTAASYGRAIALACIKANVPHWHPHQLRHSFATRIRREHGLEAARVMLGHRSATITATYAELDRAKACEIALLCG
jgi:integrase